MFNCKQKALWFAQNLYYFVLKCIFTCTKTQLCPQTQPSASLPTTRDVVRCDFHLTSTRIYSLVKQAAFVYATSVYAHATTRSPYYLSARNASRVGLTPWHARNTGEKKKNMWRISCVCAKWLALTNRRLKTLNLNTLLVLKLIYFEVHLIIVVILRF